VPNGKFTGPVKFVYAGDVAKAKTLSGYARTLIGNVSSMTSLGDVSSGWQKSTTPEGAVILVNTQSADPVAHIYYPPGGGKKGEEIIFQYAFTPRDLNAPMSSEFNPYQYPAKAPASTNHPTLMMDTQTHENKIDVYAFHRYKSQFPALSDPGYGNTFWTDGKKTILSWLADAGKTRSWIGSIYLLQDGYVIAQLDASVAGSIHGACIKDGYLFILTRKHRLVPLSPPVDIGGINGVNSYNVEDLYVYATPYVSPGWGKVRPILRQSDFEEILYVDMDGYMRCSGWARFHNAASDAGAFGYVGTDFRDRGLVVNKDGTEATMITADVQFGIFQAASDNLYPLYADFYQHTITLEVSQTGPVAEHEAEQLPYVGAMMVQVPYTPDPSVYVRDYSPGDVDLSAYGHPGKTAKTIIGYDYNDVSGELHSIELWYEDLIGSYQGSDFYDTIDGAFRRGVMKYRDAQWYVHEPLPGTDLGLYRVLCTYDIRFEIFIFITVGGEGTFFSIERYEEDLDGFRELYKIKTADATLVTSTSGYYRFPIASGPYSTRLADEYSRLLLPCSWEISSGFATPGYYPWARLLSVRSRDEFVLQYTPAEVAIPNRLDEDGNFRCLINGYFEVFYDENDNYDHTEYVSFDKIMRLVKMDDEQPIVPKIILGDMTLIRDPEAEKKSV
jgi:hypothetical protein